MFTSSQRVAQLLTQGARLHQGPAGLHTSFPDSNNIFQTMECHRLNVRQGCSWPLPNGVHTDSRLIMKGSTRTNANRFNLDLVCGNGAQRNIAFHFNPRFSCNVTVMNTKTAGNWDTEDRKSLVISPGGHFYIEFILTAAGILVLVNNVLFTTFPHRHNPQTITHLQLEGDAELHEAFFYTKKIAPINHVKQLTDCILLDTKQDSKWLLSRGFKPGSRLVMKGSTKRTACRFSLNLECQNKPVRTIAFHFNPRFSHYQTVMNTMTAGHWDDERHGALTISPGREFCIEFICQREGFKVLVNNEFFTNFSHRHNAQEITHLKLDGDAELRQVCYFPVKDVWG